MRTALAALPGVRHVEVDYETKQAVVTIEQNAYDEGKLVQALKEAGFGGSIKQTRQIAAMRTEVAQKEARPHGNGLEPPKPGISAKLSATDTEKTTYSSAGFGKHLQVSAHLDRDVLQPGDSFRVAVVIDINKSWHIYGNPVGPGIGKETVVSAEAAKGFRFDPTRYAPAEKEEQDFGEAGKTWVWQHIGKTIHYLSGKVDDSVAPDSYLWVVRVSAQVCDPGHCIPGTATVPVKVTVVSSGEQSTSVHESLFAGFAKAKPSSDVEEK